MANSPDLTSAAIALNRFGLGARPDEPLPAQPRRFLLDQFNRWEPRSAAWTATPASASLISDAAQSRRSLRDRDEEARKAARKDMRREARDDYLQSVQARVTSALVTPAPFVERLVHFWSNHFAISVEKAAVANLAGPLELEAIRPNVLGRFEDMLLAVERHPGMLLYLDQARSIGPDSLLAQRVAARRPQGQGEAGQSAPAAARRGLNENLAREIMELHTLGVRSGYTQEDVTEFARAMTGWTLGGLVNLPQAAGAARRLGLPPEGMAPEASGSFAFVPALHEPGSRVVMGRRYDQPGEGQALAILRDLASSQATARHLATKLARHFVADNPPDVLVNRMTEAYLRSNGDLPSVYRVLVEAPEAWLASAGKFKTPWEWCLSTLRGLGRRDTQGLQIAPILNQLGQPVWRPGSPAGWDDIAASWAAPDALVRRVELAQRFAARAGNSVDPRALADKLLPGAALGEPTATAIARAESGATGLALLLVSPDFLRR